MNRDQLKREVEEYRRKKRDEILGTAPAEPKFSESPEVKEFVAEPAPVKKRGRPKGWRKNK